MPIDKHNRFITRSTEPFNGGTPPEILRRSFITPVEQFFVRSHAPVPVIDADAFRLSIGGLVREQRKFSLDELKRRFGTHITTATLACAGNRRLELAAIKPVAGEVPWGAEAISNARWEGALLRDVLAAANPDEAAATNVEFVGLDHVMKAGKSFGFGGSIPIDKASSDEALLAWGMNGAPLLPVHGFPLRVVVPGYIGARSVKWLGAINVLERPSENFFQARAYKLFAPAIDEANADWAATEALGELGVNSVITSPADGSTVSAGQTRVEGYAIAGEGKLERVEISTDGGVTWVTATLLDDAGRWTWRFWEARVSLPPGLQTIIARAFDSAGGSQPPDASAIWNFKGYMNNAWHRVTVKAET
jgi:sulfite oxidase